MKDTILQFFEHISQNPSEIYSETGLHHEFANFISHNHPGYSVKINYPVSRVFNPTPKLIKRDIDMFIVDDKMNRHAIDLVIPKDDSGNPVEMYRAVQGVKFMEQLGENDIETCTAVLLTKRKLFWSDVTSGGIYDLFSGDSVNLRSADNKILKASSLSKKTVDLNKAYKTNWNNLSDIKGDLWKYYIINI